MSRTTHHALIITTFKEDLAEELREHIMGICEEHHEDLTQILRLDPDDFPIEGPFRSPINGYYTLILTPDGSKTGWTTDEVGDRIRDDVVELIDEYEYVDGSSPIEWVEVHYGDDPPLNGTPEITRHP